MFPMAAAVCKTGGARPSTGTSRSSKRKKINTCAMSVARNSEGLSKLDVNTTTTTTTTTTTSHGI